MENVTRRNVLAATAAAGGALTAGAGMAAAKQRHERAMERASGSETGTSATCDLVVDPGGGGDHETIQAAVDAASEDENICVNAGVYEEQVTVETAGLTLFARRRANHTAISASGTVVDIVAPDVVFIGFTVSALTGTAVDAGPRTGLRNCRLVTADTTGVAATESVFLVGNEFEDVGVDGQEGVAVAVEGVRGTPESDTDGVFVVRNTFHDHRYGVRVVDSSEVLLRDNTFERARYAAVEVVATGEDPARRYLVEGNDFQDNANGIILLERDDGSRLERVQVTGNTFENYVWGVLTATGLVPYDYDDDGEDELVPNPGALDGGTVVGTCNYWGGPTGPTHSDNRASRRNYFTRQALGTNDKVSNGVDFRPWAVQSVDPDEERVCVGGLGGDEL